MLNTTADIQRYIETKDPATIASLLRKDQELCRRGELPSRLALFLPPANTEKARLICQHLQQDEASRIPLPVIRVQYAGIIEGIKAHLAHLDDSNPENPLPISTTEFQISAEEAKSARKVLGNLLRHADVNPNMPLKEVMEILLNYARADLLPSPTDPSIRLQNAKGRKRKCYICHFVITTPHTLYSSLCEPCGQFNIAESNISLPTNLSLIGKTALVTGGRVNLGFHTALRLLRCGARVIVSSRYPHDAEKRFLTEVDSSLWSERLRVVGADFRAANDVFRMVAAVKEQLMVWSREGGNNETSPGKLDILINNAAQTLTDSLEREKIAIELEQKLYSHEPQLVISSRYQARVRGTSNTSWLLEDTVEALAQGGGHTSDMPADNSTNNSSLYKPPAKSSWMQSLQQIPYEDFVSAYSVNAFVPLILIRELLPLMGQTPSYNSPSTAQSSSTKGLKPHAYIINVSSREGIFEDYPASSSKRGHHVHTNMSKAGLNMITETEAAAAWHNSHVAINSVDPGYMSAAPEIDSAMKAKRGEVCPIGWEDGAGRVLWPIARGEIHGERVWGRFLKHFRGVEVGRR
jgi:NAD(P)-dependent dehydrogenase (short-subunit alcohol dehydrogenase family)